MSKGVFILSFALIIVVTIMEVIGLKGMNTGLLCLILSYLLFGDK